LQGNGERTFGIVGECADNPNLHPTITEKLIEDTTAATETHTDDNNKNVASGGSIVLAAHVLTPILDKRRTILGKEAKYDLCPSKNSHLSCTKVLCFLPG
jgi:hypothetical protein